MSVETRLNGTHPTSAAGLQQRVAELERRVAVQQQTIDTLRTERDNLLAILNKLPAFVSLQSPDYLVQFANDYFVNAFGAPEDRRCHRILVGCEVSCSLCPTYKVFSRGNEPQTWESTLTDGRYYQIYAYPFFSNDGMFLVLELGIDITERKKAELEVQRLNADLEQRVADRTAQLAETIDRLQEEIGERQRAEQQLRLFEAVAANAPDGMAMTHADGTIIYANPALRMMIGQDHLCGGIVRGDLLAPEDRHCLPAITAQVKQRGVWQGKVTYQRHDGTTFNAHLSFFAICDDKGQIVAYGEIVRDITDQVRAEAERENVALQMIAAQQQVIRELNTPLLPLADHVVALPLVGAIDSARSQQIVETLLAGVAAHQARAAIVDITGLDAVDTHVAQTLVRAAQAVRLLGAQIILTGVGPAMAQTLVGLGTDFTGMTTFSTLRAGIASAMRATR